jgi:signal transduction histidine kinase
MRLLVWSGASAVFIGAFLLAHLRPKVPVVPVLAAQSASVVTMVAVLCNGYEGLLLAVVAAQLALRMSGRAGLIWIGAQSAAMLIAISFHWSLRPALLLTPPYLGFQLLLFAALRMQSELAEKSRAEERLRIAQDLHDSLGHHLVALNLNLEWAAHVSQGPVRASVRSAQALARALLREVKCIVRSSSDTAIVDFPAELRQLARELPRPKLHVNCPADLRIDDPPTSRALLRTMQEIVTNAIRHGEAENLWIDVEQSPEGVRLSARDDGRAVTAMAAEGFGLTGMRRRLEELGGTFRAAPAAESGFEVHATFPRRSRAS